MRHLKSTKKFKRTTEERKRLWIDLASALIQSGKIVTFTTRAKWFRPKFERLVTLVKRSNGDEALAFRKVRPFLSEKDAKKLISEIASKYTARNGGYTKQFKLADAYTTQDQSVVLLVD